MISPKDCTSIDEIRDAIDLLDREIISLLGKRFEFVKEIVKFKSNATEIKAQARYDEVMRTRRELAEENGLSPEVIENIYKILIAHNIEEEHKILNAKK